MIPLVILALCLVALAWPIGRAQLRRLVPRRRSAVSLSARLIIAFVTLTGLGVVAMWLGVRALGWTVVLLILAGTIGGLWQTGRRRKRRVLAAREVARAARVLAGQLRLGQVPSIALVDAARDCPVLVRAAAASSSGASVPEALRAGALEPGQHGLTMLAAAWELSARTGAPIADVFIQVAEGLREEEALAAAVGVEIAPARTTGRILAVLPLAGLGLGFLAGGNPVQFFATHWLGEVLVVVGVALSAVGLWWLERMAAQVEVPR